MDVIIVNDLPDYETVAENIIKNPWAYVNKETLPDELKDYLNKCHALGEQFVEDTIRTMSDITCEWNGVIIHLRPRNSGKTRDVIEMARRWGNECHVYVPSMVCKKNILAQGGAKNGANISILYKYPFEYPHSKIVVFDEVFVPDLVFSPIQEVRVFASYPLRVILPHGKDKASIYKTWYKTK